MVRMPSALGALLSAVSPSASWGSVEAPLLVRVSRWISLVFWVVVFASQLQAVVSGGEANWTLLVLTTALFAGVHLRLWYEESERGRQVHRVFDRARGRVYEDDLTGLPNSRHFLFELRRQMVRSVRSGQGFSLVVAEVQPTDPADPPGPDLVRTLARGLQQALDPTDFVARLQECTFAVLVLDDGQLTASEKAAVLGEVVIAGIPIERAASLRPVVSVTGYSGETHVRGFLTRAQDDFGTARRRPGRVVANPVGTASASRVRKEVAA